MGGFINTYELVNLGARKFLLINKLHNFQCMRKMFCVEFHTKYLTHKLKETIFNQYCKFKSSVIYELVSVLETPPDACLTQGHHGDGGPLHEEYPNIMTRLDTFFVNDVSALSHYVVHPIICMHEYVFCECYNCLLL